jgi:glycosyltransferase involved in cell wall biosynthesis
VLAFERGIAPQVSIVIPVYDEEACLPSLVEEIGTALAERRETFEVIFVDDCSRDGTLDVLRDLALCDGRIRVLRLASHGGQSAALAAGLSAVRGSIIVTMDGDRQNDPADLPTLLDALDDADMVSGFRAIRRDSAVRRLSSRVANAVRRRVLGDSIRDIGCSLKAYRAEVIRDVPRFDGMHRFLPALVELGGARVVEVPVHHRPRERGVSKYGIHNRLWRGLVDLWALRWMTRRRMDRQAERVVDEGSGAGERR